MTSISEPTATAGEDTVYVCIDVEASGPVPAPYNLVSIGAVPVLPRTRAGRPVWEVDESNLFYVELRPLYDGFAPEAMAVHGISRDTLEKNGLPPREAMAALVRWTRALGRQPVFVGHNAVFDWSFVNHYFVATGVNNPYGWKALDTKSLAAGVLGIPFLETSKENLARLLPGLGPEDTSRKHRADYDALYQARILTLLLDP
ncbi:MAG: exonuclease domain-containing protein [Acidobacteriota bacterium]